MDDLVCGDDLVRELIAQADVVLAGQQEEDERLVALELYVTQLAAWYDGQGCELTSANVSSQSADLLRELGDRHTQVLKLVEQLRNDTSSKLKVFRQRTRGILSYLDTLPKRISVLRSKKG